MNIKCEEIQNNLRAYLDNELSRKEHKIIETHLQKCDKCKASLEFIEMANSAIIKYKTEMPSEALPVKIFTQLEKEKQTKASIWDIIRLITIRPYWAPSLSIGGFLITMAMALILLNTTIAISKDREKELLTQIMLKTVTHALESFKRDMGDYPYPKGPREQGGGLKALINVKFVNKGIAGGSLTKFAKKWRGPYIRTEKLMTEDSDIRTLKTLLGKTIKIYDGIRDVPLDGWDRPFVYTIEKNGRYNLYSQGENINDFSDDIKIPEKYLFLKP